MHRRLIRLALAAFLMGLASMWLVGSMLSRSSNSPVNDAVAPAQDVHFTARDGLAIAGTYWPGARPDAPGILLLHGNGASREAMAASAEWLSRQGYATLAIDFRGHGESASADHSFGLFEARDAHAAIAWLRQRQGGARIGVVGGSLGGAASLIGEQGPLPADAMVLVAVYPAIRDAVRNRLGSRLGRLAGHALEPLLSYQSWLRQGVSPDLFSPLEAVRRVSQPVLVIGGAEDVYTPPDETRMLHAAAAGPKELWIVPGMDHNAIMAVEQDAILARIKGFFDAALVKDGI